MPTNMPTAQKIAYTCLDRWGMPMNPLCNLTHSHTTHARMCTYVHMLTYMYTHTDLCTSAHTQAH